MVLTVTLEKEWREGKIAHAIVKITFDASYLTGGELLDLSAYMKNIWHIDGYITEDAPGYLIDFDDTPFNTTRIVPVELNFGDYDNVADGPLIEASGDLSSVSARIHAFGDAF